MRLPTDKQRIAILGRTGSGKSVAGLWHLSKRRFDEMPWIIVDFKTDENINAITRANILDGYDAPTKPGIYITQPHPQDAEGLDKLLRNVWEKGNTGILIDEGYMMKENSNVENAFVALLTQGRSKRIPMIVLSQRPVWLSRFVFSESDFFQTFHLQDERDVKTIASFLPSGAYKRMPDYHSLYYDVGRNALDYLAPVPAEDKIIAAIDSRLPAKRIYL